ncbi:MAG: Stk1 family PASTA domain-containing Ser/Thr kinase [Clostridia bacterium]|nr:Stk1 family PASTA domain-containing Ser/Thr kinase [Clostridia bacterium]
MENYCGKRLDGRYEIREIIGVGGMAVVYKAYDNMDDRIVAVKILKEELLTNEESRRRFKNESKAIAVLSHPNIVKVYDVSFGDRIQYIVMEYVEGITLKEYIEQQGVVNWKEAVHFVSQILLALQHAHDKGIVHRDIKPQNIMLLQDGSIKVADFGIARFNRSDTRTMTEDAIGSVHYISPEQARGDYTDDKSDLYSVGVVMYEMLTGQLPFQSDSAVSIALMQVQQEAKPPREINPSIPLGLEQITMRAMQKNPNDRYQSAAEMMLDIDEFKRNPTIKFNYNYFVDDQPTRFVDRHEQEEEPVHRPRAERPAPRTRNTPARKDEDEDDNTEPNKTLPILFGVLAGIIVIIGIIIGILVYNNSHKIEVPNFIGKNYTEEIENNTEYEDFKFETKLVADSDATAGEVLNQDPPANTKVKKGSTITLEIASNDDNVLINGIIGKTAEEAENILRQSGFEVVVVNTFDKNTAAGVVFDSNPSEKTYAPKGSTVTIYVATDESTDEVSVPDVLQYKREDAIKLLKSSEYEFVVTVTEVDSDKDKGTVVDQSPKASLKVKKGSTIVIYVSTGVPAENTAKITFDLPKAVSSTEGTMKVFVGGNDVLTEKVTLDGKSKTVEVTGKGTKNIKITINDQTIYTCTVDFTKSEPSASNVDKKTYSEKAAVPNVVGKSVTDAQSILEKAGFTNVTVVGSDNNPAPSNGTVVSQTPVSDNSTYSLSEPIRLVAEESSNG